MLTPLTPAEFMFLDAYALENQRIVIGPCTEALIKLGVFPKNTGHRGQTRIMNLLLTLQDIWRSDSNRDAWTRAQGDLSAPPCPWTSLDEVLARNRTVRDDT